MRPKVQPRPTYRRGGTYSKRPFTWLGEIGFKVRISSGEATERRLA